MTKSELIARLEKATGLSLAGISGHKLCDFRPFFGLAFADLLRDYAFWGYCDLDMMFGDLGKLLTAEFMASADAFSAHSKQFVGHFTLLRNTEAINNLARQIPDWQELCVRDKAEHVDEERFSQVIAQDKSLRWVRPEPLASELNRPFCRHGITYTFRGRLADLPANLNAVVRWHNGRTVLIKPDGSETEILYVHFMAIKHWWHWFFQKKKTGDQAPSHYFSRIGHGVVKTPDDLQRFFPRLVYLLQCTALDGKIYTGKILQAILPRELFKTVRRKFRV